MDLTISQLDNIAYAANKTISAEFETSGFSEEPPKITMGIVRHVLLAAASITAVQCDARFDPVCRKCGDPLVSYELVCDDCRCTP